MKVALLFRGKDRNEVSIETLFGCLIPYLQREDTIEKYYVPYGHHNKLKNIIANLHYVRKVKADIYHITGEIYIAGCVTPKKQTIITMHDYVNLEMFSGIKRWVSWLLWDYIPLKRCRYVVCISKKICKETEERFPFCKNKIVYIPNAVDDSYKFCPDEFNEEKPRILVVGTRKNKNLERIIMAVSGMKCTLHIIGKLCDTQQELLQKEKTDYINEFNISNDDMLRAYQECDMVCFPSMFEGFGRPIIEAQAVGRPVITSKWEPMRSVANDGAVLVNPENIGEIRDAIKMITRDQNLRESLIKAGLANAQNYSAEKIANEYTKLYASVAGNEYYHQ